MLLGWLLGAGTQFLRDRRQAQIALMLVGNELIGNIAQLDLAQRLGADDHGVHTSHWLRRWRLSRTAYDQQGAMAFTLLDAEDIAKLQDAYHALDAAELLLEAAREGVIELHGTDPRQPRTWTRALTSLEVDAESREKLGIQLDAPFKAHEVVNRALPPRRGAKRDLTTDDQ